MHESTLAPVERPVTSVPASATLDIGHQSGVDPGLADDPHIMQILSTEHWSLLSARSLAYNEAFTRVGMFLTLLSMSFVGLALLAQAMDFTQDYLTIAAIVVAFDFLIGVLTFLRLAGTAREDLRATQGMNRIRQAYVRLAPQVEPFLSVGVNDDFASVLKTYQLDSKDAGGDLAYVFSTSQALVGIVMALVAGLEGAVIALLLGASMMPAILAAFLATVGVLVIATWWGFRQAAVYQAALEVRFPSEPPPAS